MNFKIPNLRKRHHKRHRLILITIGTSLLGVGSATASLLPSGMTQDWQSWVLNSTGNPLADIQQQIEQTTALAETFLQEALGQQWEALQSALGSVLPDPFRVRTADTTEDGSLLNPNPLLQQQELANRYDQELARSLSAPVLGDQGQQWLETEAQHTTERLEASQARVQAVESMAETAQGLSVTQDVLKQNAQIQASVAALLHEQTQLTAENHTALMQLQQLQGMLTQLSANTSAGIDEANRREQMERQISLSGSAQAPLYLPGVLGTDPTLAD